MKIWRNLTPHINLFSGYQELGRAHEVLVTARPLANTIDLSSFAGIAHTVVGKHYGADVSQNSGYRQSGSIVALLKDKKIDAVSQSSFHCPWWPGFRGAPDLYERQ